MLSVYPACFYEEENGYSVIFPDLNYLSTCGETLNEAMEMAVDCLAGYIYTCKKCRPATLRARAVAQQKLPIRELRILTECFLYHRKVNTLALYNNKVFPMIQKKRRGRRPSV